MIAEKSEVRGEKVETPARTMLSPAQVDACARALRDAVMDGKSSDKNWEACRSFCVADFNRFLAGLRGLGLEIAPSCLINRPRP